MDISKSIISGCKKNIRHYKVKNSSVKIGNALELNEKFDYLVSDLPYGLNSNLFLETDEKSLKKKGNFLSMKGNSTAGDVGVFYFNFLKKLSKIKHKKSVLIFPSFVDYKKIIKNAGFKIEFEYSNYVHGTLSRKIVRIVKA